MADSLVRWVVVLVLIGFPVALVLAWVYDLTAQGILRTDELDEPVNPLLAGRKADFTAIGALTVALIFSVYLNFNSEPASAEPPAPISVLIADFNNKTGDSVFDGSLEQALMIGIEGAPFITSYDRALALSSAKELALGDVLNQELARLMAVRQDIDLVLDGEVGLQDGGYHIGVSAINASSGELVTNVSGTAKSKADVLAIVGDLTADIREDLGDESIHTQADPTSETFTASSLEAAKHYTTAIDLGFSGELEKATESFRLAIDQDPNFGRAYSGLALTEFKLGNQEEAERLWEQALALMNTMTERERYRTLGLYYSVVTRNYEKAVESFANLVEKYPADAAGRNNLAVTAFLSLDFERAAREGKMILDIYPESQLYRSNRALYAMYSGDFDTARTEAQAVIAAAPDYGTAYLPLAISALAVEDFDSARAAYHQMQEAAKSEHGDSLAFLGLADIEIYAGAFEAARHLLQQGIEADLAKANKNSASVKHLAMAHAWLVEGDSDRAHTAAENAEALADADSIRVPVAIVYLETGDLAAAQTVATDLQQQLQPQSRAYGLMLQGMIHRHSSEHVQSLDSVRAALQLADLWLIRFQLGQTYLAAEQYAEALDEFMLVEQRRGEASAVFLDDTPTFRYLATLPYWIARAQEGLNMQAVAITGYQTFLDRWSGSGPLMEDAKGRIP
ncbi:MAG: tetratricopeptide repeat protein [Pseudomonadales bacterium]